MKFQNIINHVAIATIVVEVALLLFAIFLGIRIFLG